MLKAYMHGFFLDNKLYEKAKLIADPFAYEEYRKKTINDKLEKQREGRIRVSAQNKKPKVNQELADKLLADSSKKKKKDVLK